MLHGIPQNVSAFLPLRVCINVVVHLHVTLNAEGAMNVLFISKI